MLAELEQQGVVTRRALLLPDGVSESEFIALGVMLADERDKARFLLGDLLVFATARYGSDFTDQVMEATGLSFYTLRNMESVMLRVRPNVRRPELSFSHHDVVAALEPSEQKRLLGLAVKHGWSRQRLRDEVHGEKPLPPAVSQELPDVVRDALSGAREMMDGWWISRDSFTRLRAALGEEEV
jgi:hypothetical protein